MTGDSGFSELFYYNIFSIYIFCLRAVFVIKKNTEVFRLFFFKHFLGVELNF